MYDKFMAKKEMLKDLKQLMASEDDVGLKDRLDGMKKVTVAADSKEGLEKGLTKAQEILKKRSEMLGLADDMEDAECEMEDGEEEEMEDEELDSKKKKLQALLMK